MELKDFIGVAVIDVSTKRRCVIEEITSPYIQVASAKSLENGYTVHYSYSTINGDPFTNNLLIFEDSTLLASFLKAYKAYCNTRDAYYEEIGYWMRKD